MSEAAYWALKSRAVLGRESVSAVVDGLLSLSATGTYDALAEAQTVQAAYASSWQQPVEPPPEAPPALDVPAPLKARAWSGPFSKAAQVKR